MRIRIYKSLFLTGIISVVITFILTGIFHYHGLQEQKSAHLGALATTLAGVVSLEETDRSRSYLTRFFQDHEEQIHVVWLDAEGSVLYDSDGVSDERYKEGQEVRDALVGETGYTIHKDDSGKPKNYVAHLASDGSIVRLSEHRGISGGVFSGFVPETLLFVLVFMIACLVAAEHETNYILQPIRRLSEILQEIMAGKNVTAIPPDYAELRPLIAKVAEQRRDIENYLENIEEDRHTIRTIFDTISDGIILLNQDKEILEYNKKVEQIFQPDQNKRFRRIASLYHDEDWLRAIQRAYSSDEGQNYSMTLFDVPYRLSMAKVKSFDEEQGLLIVLRDMRVYQQTEQMRREFSANVSHELKTPLTSISGFAEMIASGMYANTEDVQKFAGRIYNESQRMLELIDTIMHLSKIEEKETTITWKTVSVEGLVRYATDLMQPQAEAKHIVLVADTQPLYMYGNAALLSELIMNLLDNAVKYSNDGGEVRVTLRKKEEEYMELLVSDEGIGISEDKQQRVFERFYRTDESRNRGTGGIGLGLAICKHIVEKHKGTLDISSVEGEGTVVTATLPMMSEEEVSKETVEAVMAWREAEEAKSGRLAELEAEEDRLVEAEIRKEKKEKEKLKKKGNTASSEEATAISEEDVERVKKGKRKKAKKEKKLKKAHKEDKAGKDHKDSKSDKDKKDNK